MANPLVLSASSVMTYLRCGQQWKFPYVDGIKRPPTLKQGRGLAVHAAVEVNMKQKMDTREDLPLDDVRDAARDAFLTETMDSDSTIGAKNEFLDSTVDLVTVYHKLVAPEIQPIAVELPVQYMVNGIPFSGQIDLIDEMDRVRDTKTTARRPQPAQYSFAMTGYALAFRQGTGKVETDTVLDYLVATRRPYRHPVHQGGPASPAQVSRFATIIESTARSIEAGRFVPNGLASGACGWCPYKDICPAYDRARIDDGVPTS